MDPADKKKGEPVTSIDIFQISLIFIGSLRFSSITRKPANTSESYLVENTKQSIQYDFSPRLNTIVRDFGLIKGYINFVVKSSFEPNFNVYASLVMECEKYSIFIVKPAEQKLSVVEIGRLERKEKRQRYRSEYQKNFSNYRDSSFIVHYKGKDEHDKFPETATLHEIIIAADQKVATL